MVDSKTGRGRKMQAYRQKSLRENAQIQGGHPIFQRLLIIEIKAIFLLAIGFGAVCLKATTKKVLNASR